MEEYIDKLRSFLPINCDYNPDDESDDTEYREYIRYLRDAFVENISNGKYQFALLAFHMMFMSFIYRQFWCLKEHDYEKVRRLCEANARFGNVAKTFDISEIPEKDVIDNTMNVLRFHVNRRSDVKNFVDTRDKCAHASGYIQYNADKVKTHFDNVLEYVEQIHNKSKESVFNSFLKVLHEYWDSDSYSSYLSVEQATRIIKTMGLSPSDILYIQSIDIDIVLNGRTQGTYLISYYIIQIVLKAYIVDNYYQASDEYDCTDEIDQFKKHLLTLEFKDYADIEIELEDEVQAINEFYAYTLVDDFMEEINLLRREKEAV